MADFVSEQILDKQFIELLRTINVFQTRHGVSGTNYVEVINKVRQELLERVGHKTAFKNAMEPWTEDHVEILLSCYEVGHPLFKLSKTLGRSEAALKAKLDNLKFRAVIDGYDEIILALAKQVVESFGETYDLDEDWLLSWADQFWCEKANEHLKEKVEKFSNRKKEVSTEESGN